MFWLDTLGELLQQMDGFEGVLSHGTLIGQGQRVAVMGTGYRRGTGEAGAPFPQPCPAALTIQCSETWAGRQTARPRHTQLSFSSPASA